MPLIDVVINKAYPAVIYEPTETGGQYHEDREYADATALGSRMFRTINAVFNTTLSTPAWELVDTTRDAYAWMQDSHGGLHFYRQDHTVVGSSPWASNAWLGNGNNTVFNAVDYGMDVGDATGTSNWAALQLAIAAAIAANGGTVFIPSGTYKLSNPSSLLGITVGHVQGGIIIAGSSTGTILIKQESGDMFDCSNDGFTNQSGIRFRYLTFQYKDPLTSPSGIAINCNTSGGLTTAEKCSFINCPQAFSCGTDGLANHCGLINCVVTLDSNNGANNTQIVLSGVQDFVIDCIIMQQSLSNSGPVGVTAIQVTTSHAARIARNQIADFTTGIAINDNANVTCISDNEIECVAGIVIKPLIAGPIYGVIVNASTVAM